MRTERCGDMGTNEPKAPRSLIGRYVGDLRGTSRPYFEQDLAERDEHGFELEQARQELAHLRSLHPIPIIRTTKRLERKQRKLEERLARLQHEVDLLEGLEGSRE